MRLVQELKPKTLRQLRHTLLQARDGKFFKVLTYQLYDRTPPPEFHNFEVNVQEVDEQGKFRELIVPYFRRYFQSEPALAHHQELLENFDQLLNIEEAKPEHKKEKEDAAH